jgi:hypothetical protein
MADLEWQRDEHGLRRRIVPSKDLESLPDEAGGRIHDVASSRRADTPDDLSKGKRLDEMGGGL